MEYIGIEIVPIYGIQVLINYGIRPTQIISIIFDDIRVQNRSKILDC